MYGRESGWGGFFCGLLIGAGLVVLGYFLVTGAMRIKQMERTVSVKGLSERLVKADVAIYPIVFSVADNSPAVLYKKVLSGRDAVIEFLHNEGFSDDEISISAPQITDNYATGYNSNARYRYTAKVITTLYTHKVDKVINLGKELFKLSKEGVMATNIKFDTTYLYTKLNAIKPKMVDEAIQNAQQTAEKFAEESHSVLGKIKSAHQGYFSITNRDTNTPYIKRIRVVVGVVYYLK